MKGGNVEANSRSYTRVHIDVMNMLKSDDYKYIAHARDSLIEYSEFRLFRANIVKAMTKFVFEDIISR